MLKFKLTHHCYSEMNTIQRTLLMKTFLLEINATIGQLVQDTAKFSSTPLDLQL